jgi:hypothetical protein
MEMATFSLSKSVVSYSVSYRQVKRRWLLVSTLMILCAPAIAQVNISGVINQNTAVTEIQQPNCSDCDPDCKDTIVVENAASFQVGDLALIIQMKGAVVDVSNTITGGQITDIANAGNYEFFIVDSVDLASNLIFPEYGLIKAYDEAGQVQIIRIPNYGKHPVTVTNTLTAPTWEESNGTGGVVALVAKKLILNANIDVIGKGFKGNQMTVNGTPDNCSINPTSAYTLNSTATQSYTKGEGIVADNTAYNRGRSPRGNGGGSGISGDSGGGGGSSYGQGGIGGKRWCDPFGAEAGGLGGVSLSSYFLEDKLFLGGAGGSGYVTTNNPSDATDGGGIVILFVDTIVGNGYSILADGTSPVLVNPVGPPDGGGGGGGGGSVLLNVRDIQGNLTVSADGGDGQDLNTTNYHGPGGGGGGGVLLYSLPSLPANVSFSADGGSSGVHSDGVANDAGDGAVGGTFGLYVPIENVNYRANVDKDDVAGVCDIDDDNDGIPDIQEIYTGDHDGDGLLDFEDPDFCTAYFDTIPGWDCAVDGLPNPTADIDGDGYPNFFDADFPYCGSFVLGVDQICSAFDPDGDGAPSHLDLDSDNDGIPDIIEAGGVDEDGDGQADDMTDSDGDGLVDLYDNDDTDGPAGSSPCAPQSGCLEVNSYTVLASEDHDLDTIPDFLDLDADNDGIPDAAEGGGVDTNGDGRIDGFGDLDEDGLSDRVDANVQIVNPEFGFYVSASSVGVTNGDYASGPTDYNYAEVFEITDSLVLDLGKVLPIGTRYELRWRRKASYTAVGTADMRVEESEDGIAYAVHSVTPQDATQVYANSVMYAEQAVRYLRLSTVAGSNDDFEFDAVIYSDTIYHNGSALIRTGGDANGDAVPDSYLNADADGDLHWNGADLDSDDDGVPDVVESGGVDTNGDGWLDVQADMDNDGYLNSVDADPENMLVLADDGVGSNHDRVQHKTGPDLNQDGRPDAHIEDDADGDGILNLLDLDSDNDGLPDLVEAGGVEWSGLMVIDTDADSDGLKDAVDADKNNDGIVEQPDSALVITGPDLDFDAVPDAYPVGDQDGDGFLNGYDIDTDGDGIIDNLEAQETTINPIQPVGNDNDADGLDNAFDPDQGGNYLTGWDTDGDGQPDCLDLDSDDDLEGDEMEGWDANGDGTQDVLSLGVDMDGDGLDDAFDDVLTLDPFNGPSNAQQTAFDFPNADGGSDERDWRELPCKDGTVVLANAATQTVASAFCGSNGWTYFYDPAADSLLLFAVEKYPDGVGANTSDIELSASLQVSANPASEAGLYSTVDEAAGKATFVLGRYWNIQVNAGTLNGYVNVRFFFAPKELDTLEAVAEKWNDEYAGSTPMVSGLTWFAKNAGSFGTADITSEGIINAFELTAVVDSFSPGIQSATFSMSTLTGGSVAYTIGTNSSILAAELVDFDAGVMDDQSVLTIWQTSSEVNTDRFFVERSKRGKDWVYVGEVAAAGNASTPRFYELLDHDPYQGSSYYRLQIIDFDGSAETSDVVKVYVDDSDEESSILVYPNPNNGSFNITLHAAGGIEGAVQLCTMQGSLLQTWPIHTNGVDSHQFTISNLAKGHYLVVWNQASKVLTTKVIVN